MLFSQRAKRARFNQTWWTERSTPAAFCCRHGPYSTNIKTHTVYRWSNTIYNSIDVSHPRRQYGRKKKGGPAVSAALVGRNMWSSRSYTVHISQLAHPLHPILYTPNCRARRTKPSNSHTLVNPKRGRWCCRHQRRNETLLRENQLNNEMYTFIIIRGHIVDRDTCTDTY